MVEDFSALYYADPYMKDFEAMVVSISRQKDGFAVELSQTCFYPEGGGQAGDKGVLLSQDKPSDDVFWQVIDTQLQGDRIVHICSSADGLQVGQTVRGAIDWERRFDFMQQHSSEHIFSGLVNKKFGYNNVGFHINEDEMYFDFDGYLSEVELTQLETEVNRVIVEQVPILISTHEQAEIDELEFRSKKAIPEALRLVTIEDIDCCACCGTQLRNTSEIGFFIIRESMKYKSGVRVTALAGFRALRYVQNLLSSSRSAASQLSVKPLELALAVKGSLQKLQASEGLSAKMSKLYLDSLRAEISPEMKKTYRYFVGFSDKQVKHYCKSMADAHKGVHYAILATQQEKRLQYVIASSHLPVEQDVELINVALNGKGGGRGGFAQGSISVDFATARTYLDMICTPLKTLIL